MAYAVLPAATVARADSFGVDSAAVVASEPGIAVALTNLAHTLPGAVVRTDVAPNSDLGAIQSAIPRLAHALPVPAQTAIHALGHARASFKLLTIFAAETRVAETAFIEADTMRITILWARLDIGAVFSTVTRIA